jgi:hypothetical protein
MNGEPNFSEMTPGYSWEMACNKRIWDFDMETTSQKEFAEMLSTAETCPHFKKVKEMGRYPKD